MKKINLSFVVMLLTILVSCKSKETKEKETKEVEVKSVKNVISGDFEEYVSIVDGNYKMTKSGSNFILPVKLKFLKPCDFLWTDGMEFTEGTSKSFDNLTIDLLDESGTPLGMKMKIDPQLWSSQSESEKLTKALKKGSGEDFYTFHASGFPYRKELESQLEKVKKFQISSSMGSLHSGSPNTESSTSSSNDNNNEEESNKSETKVSKIDCDKYLNSYEKFATNYVAIAKKYKNNPNDKSLAIDALKMNTDLAEWATKVSDLDGCVDAEYITKLASIQAKLSEAALILGN
jgi:hypothetical protein